MTQITNFNNLPLVEDDFNDSLSTQNTSVQANEQYDIIDSDDSGSIDTEENLIEQYLPNQSESQEYSNAEYSAAIDILQEYRILNIPDDLSGELTGELFNEIIEYDQNIRNEAAFEHVKSLAGDDYVRELFDLAYSGGTREDLEEAKSLLNDETTIKEVDVENESDQQYIIGMYLQVGLDPKLPSHKIRLDNIDSEVMSYINKYKGKEMAEKAKDYFLAEIKKNKTEMKERLEAETKHNQELAYQQRVKEEQWRTAFVSKLQDRSWNSAKKNNVLKQMSQVQLEDGSSKPLWQFKMEHIWNNPEQTHLLMDFLADYDPYQLKFVSREIPVEKQVTSKILDLVSKKQNKNRNSNRYESNGNYSDIVDPLSD